MRSGPSSPRRRRNCDRSDPADDHKGDYWDHVAFDPEHRLVVAVVPGARDVEGTEALVGEFRRRTGGRAMGLMTSDRLSGLRDGDPACLRRDGHAAPHRQAGPAQGAVHGAAPGLAYAAVEKVREKGRVVEIVTRVVFGTMAAVAAALAGSGVSRSINTSFAGASQRDGPAPQRQEVAEDLSVLEGLALPRGGHLLHDV